MSSEAFVDAVWEERATAILRTDDQQVAHDAMDAAVRGGFRLIEFTLGCPGPFELIAEFAGRGDVVVGAGTVLKPEDAKRAIDAGAKFIVSPVVDEAVIKTAVEAGVAAMPGTHTPTEMLQAWRWGAQLQKLFPAPAGGPAYVRATLGPLPFLRIVPTNGVDADNVGDWIAAGVWGVGFVTTLFAPETLANRDYGTIEENAKASLAAAHAATRPERSMGSDPFAAKTAAERPVTA